MNSSVYSAYVFFPQLFFYWNVKQKHRICWSMKFRSLCPSCKYSLSGSSWCLLSRKTKPYKILLNILFFSGRKEGNVLSAIVNLNWELRLRNKTDWSFHNPPGRCSVTYKQMPFFLKILQQCGLSKCLKQILLYTQISSIWSRQDLHSSVELYSTSPSELPWSLLEF